MKGAKTNILDLVEADYLEGFSIPQLHERYGITLSTLRYQLKKRGVLRTRAEGVRLAAKQGRLGDGLRGKTRVFTQEHKDNISKARLRWADAGNAVGVSLRHNGYVLHTRGPNKGRSVHVAKIEARIGRPLLEDEVVHHIDGDRSNNDDNNLALLTRSGHSRLHRREDRLAGKFRERQSNGQFS